MSRLDWLSPLALVGAVLCVAPACGGDDDDDNVDAGPGGGDAGACPVVEALGSFDPLPAASALHFTQDNDKDPTLRYLSVAGNVSDSRLDLLLVELWDNFGAFEGGQLEAGTFAIEGDEAALQSCGVCIQLLVNVTRDASGAINVDKQYVGTGGTVTVESIGTRDGDEFIGNYTGSVSGLTLVEVDPTPMSGGVPLPGGCETGIESTSWDAVIENGDDE